MARKPRNTSFEGMGDHDRNGSTGGARKPVKVGEIVTVHTRNPINGLTEQDGEVRKVVAHDRVVVAVAYHGGGETVFPATLGEGDQFYTRKPLKGR